MSRTCFHFVTAAVAAFLILPGTPAAGQIKVPLIGGKGKQPPPESSVLDKSSEDFYLDMKDFAEGLYNKQTGTGENRQDSDFKKKVDTEYEAMKRKDAERAYEVNLSAHSEVKRVIEDRFRVFSGLYDNLLVQDLLNRTGQSIIPPTTDRLYTFKLKADPIPGAETLSTGTIYVTTGLISLLDTKAELAYVLAHEAAHVYHNDFRTEIMLNLAAEEYAKERGANQEAITNKLSILFGTRATVGAGFGGPGLGGARVGGGVQVGSLLSALFLGPSQAENEPVVKDWNSVQEDEADKTAFEWVSRANLDITQIPKVYQALKDAGDRDQRVTLGFLGRTNRVRERAKKVDGLIAVEKAKPEFATKVWEASDPDFDVLMAEVKRDNGVLAFQYDMLDLAKDNLAKAVAIKSTDPTALYFYAKILKETARTDEDRANADNYFRLAAANDSRNLNYGAQLHRAVALLKPDATTSEKREAVGLLKSYIEDYYLSSVQDMDSHHNAYPPHLETIYDYMSRLGEFQYVFDPAKLAAQQAQAQKAASGAGNAVDLKTDATGPASVKTPASPKPAAAKSTTKQ